MRRRSCATWPPPAATRCSAPGACTSRTSRRRATSANPGGGCSALGGLHPPPRDPRRVRSTASPPTRPTWRWRMAALDARVQVLGPDGEREVPFVDLHRLPGDEPDARHRARARRADHRDRPAGAAVRPAGRPTARSATGRPTRSRWSPWPPRCRGGDGVVEDVRVALGGVAPQAVARATAPRSVLRGDRPDRSALPRGGRSRAGRGPSADGIDGGNGFKIPLRHPHLDRRPARPDRRGAGPDDRTAGTARHRPRPRPPRRAGEGPRHRDLRLRDARRARRLLPPGAGDGRAGPRARGSGPSRPRRSTACCRADAVHRRTAGRHRGRRTGRAAGPRSCRSAAR